MASSPADADPRAWLFTILRNLYLNNVRQRNRRGPHVEYQETDGQFAADGDSERSLIGRDALLALDALPEEQRSLLLLIAVEDFTYQEAANCLACRLAPSCRASTGRGQIFVN